jgi:hypothetical protein
MATTMNLIAKQTVGSGGMNSFTFSNIPQTYTDLKIVWSARKIESGGSTNVQMRFNGSTSSYSQILLYGLGSGTPGSASDTSEIGFMYVTDASQTANAFASTDIYIPNYASTSTYKSVSIDNVTEQNATSATAALTAALWSSNSAITSIYFQVGNGASNFAEFSTFYLYGISKSSTQNESIPYASGGDVIATDGTYWYHAFKSSGSFTPTKNISADVLVIAGGGGGGSGHGGGGGAGGVLAFTSQSLIKSTSYTCLVGAGGAGGLPDYSQGGVSGSNSQFTSLTATIGGGGGGSYNNALGTNGGSGGGGGGGPSSNLAGKTGTSGQGNTGGDGTSNGTAGNGGGGGGKGAVGSNASGAGSGSGSGGNGGTGVNTVTNWGALSAALTSTATGVSGYIAGGGGGGAWQATGGTGGAGGGGNGRGAGYNGGGGVNAGFPAVANTGSGGGGGPDYNNGGGAGGSGIIILRYAV